MSELINLKVGDYHEKEGLLSVKGKGDVQRLIPVGEIAVELLHLYLEKSRNILKGNHIHNLYSLHRPKRKYAYKTSCVEEVFTLLRNCSGESQGSYTATLLCFSSSSRREPIYVLLQELLGHKDIRTTQIYIHSQSEDLYQQFRTFHPDGKKDEV